MEKSSKNRKRFKKALENWQILKANFNQAKCFLEGFTHQEKLPEIRLPILLGKRHTFWCRQRLREEFISFSNFIYGRVSFKATTPKGFTQRTGAMGKYYELPFKALKYLLNEGIYAKAAAMTDPRIMPRE